MGTEQDTLQFRINSLCIDYAPVVLRELCQIYLRGTSLRDHLKNLSSDVKYIEEMRKSCNLSKFDFTKLVVLLNTFQLNNEDKNGINRLRVIRNLTIHERSVTHFQEAERILLNLAKAVDAKQNSNLASETRTKIENLKTMEIIQNQKQTKLRERLKQGNKYVTDFFQPVIVTGNIRDSECEHYIYDNLDIDVALTSAKLVLEFDNTPNLREKTEKGNAIFTVKTAENVYGDKQFGELVTKHPVWIYCNGYEKSSKAEEQPQQSLKEWRLKRQKGVSKALEEMKNRFSGTIKVIILLFEECVQKDPIFKICRDIIENDYPDACDLMIISENDDFVGQLRKTSSDYLYKEECEELFLTGMTWECVSEEMKTSFKVNPDMDCILPCRAGNTVIMTLKERSVFTDLEIVSGEECIHEIESMEKHQRSTKMQETKENFYKGKGISWWNFYFEGQVGKRSVLEEYLKLIRNKLEKGKHVEKFFVSHNPGAGGTTVGMHILWLLSQFSQAYGQLHAYRCCRLKKITTCTTQQLVKLCLFKEKENPKPVVVLIDDEQEDVVNDIYDELYEEARKLSHVKLLCCVVIVKRVPTGQHLKASQVFLSPNLKPEEKIWFDNKYKELEDEYNTAYVDSLISFNFLKNSYDPKVIQKTTDRLMEEIKKEEKDILKCLSVIGTFERKRHAVPFRLFDVLVPASQTKKTWNTCLSETMILLITEFQDEVAVGISVISQPLAKAILDNFKKIDGMALEYIVEFLLDLIDKNKMNGQYLLQKLKSIIGGLFKREERSGSAAPEKDDFSALVTKLMEQRPNETQDNANKRAIKELERCFELTEDPMVGQQVSRFYIHIHRFCEAEQTIVRSIQMKPTSSYLRDTYGHIYKTKMDFLIKQGFAEEKKIPDEKASEIIDVAFEAVEKFKEGQTVAYKEHLKSYKRNISCFYNEIRTAIILLENFHQFESYTNLEEFLSFLNDPFFDKNNSAFSGLVRINQRVLDLRFGTPYQVHLMNTLQYTRDRTNQIKYYKVDSEEGVLILKFSERLARFYGDSKSTGHCYFTCPIDLRALMDGMSDKKKRHAFMERVAEAKKNLESNISDIDDRDLLVYLGCKIIELSSLGEMCSEDDYKKLLFYSKCLIESQTQISGRILLEVFLYHAMLHWPSESRTIKDYDKFCPPTKYKEYLNKWEKNFYSNHSLKTAEQKEKNKPKTFFALGKGSPGNDIINLRVIQQKLRQMEKDGGRQFSGTSADEVWDEEIVKEQLQSFQGLVNGEGSSLCHKVTYSQARHHEIDIHMYKHQPELSNREVTFFLGFTWKGPAALGVKEMATEDTHDSLSASASLRRPAENHTAQRLDAKEHIKDNHDSRNPARRLDAKTHADRFGSAPVAKRSNSQAAARPKVVSRRPVLINTADQSKKLVDSILTNKPNQIVFTCICQQPNQGRSCFRLIVLHISRDEVFIYNLLESNQLLIDGHLVHLFQEKTIHKVFFDIDKVAEILIQECDLLMEGNIWDIKIMVDYLSSLEATTNQEFYRDATIRFQAWCQENLSYCEILSKKETDETVLSSLVARGEYTLERFLICKRKLDESARDCYLSEIRKKTFEVVQPPKMADRIKDIKTKEKKNRQKMQNENEKEKAPNPPHLLGSKKAAKKKKK